MLIGTQILITASMQDEYGSGRANPFVPLDSYIKSRLSGGSVNLTDDAVNDALDLPSIINSLLIYGKFGAGKTLLSVQISIRFLKKDPSASIAFFTTDGPFPSKRLMLLEDAAYPDLLERFFIFEIRTLNEFVAFLDYFLPVWHNSGPLMIIVDNLTSLVRFSDDLDEISVDFLKAVQSAVAKFRCKFIFVSQVKALIQDDIHGHGILVPALHPRLLNSGHIFDRLIKLEESSSYKVKRMIVSGNPPTSITYLIDEKKGIFPCSFETGLASEEIIPGGI